MLMTYITVRKLKDVLYHSHCIRVTDICLPFTLIKTDAKGRA